MSSSALDGSARFRRSALVEAAPLQGESILFHPESKRFYMLNATAVFVWERLGSPSGVEDLAAGLCEAFEGVEIETARRDIVDALANMVEWTLVEPIGDTHEN